MSDVEDVTYITPTQALDDFREKHKDDIEIIASLDELNSNPLSGALIVKAKSISQYSEIFTSLEDAPYQEKILDKNFDDHRKIIDRVNVIQTNVKMGVMVASAFFSIIGLLIVFNTIRVAIYTHKEEIGIMKLVGANNWFIRGPFVVQAALYGLIAFVFTVLVVYPMIGVLGPYVERFIGNSSLHIVEYFNVNFLKVFGTQLLVVIVLSVFASAIAVGKYLKV